MVLFLEIRRMSAFGMNMIKLVKNYRPPDVPSIQTPFFYGEMDGSKSDDD